MFQILRCKKLLSSSFIKNFTKLKAVPSILPSRSYSHMNYDEWDYTHLEGEEQVQGLTLPLSDEQRAKLAAKYNMRPEDYEPLVNENGNFGDYPTLPRESCLARDPNYDWDDPHLRRNWGEPIFEDTDAYLPEWGSDTRPTMLDPPQMGKVLLGFFVGATIAFLLGYKYTYFPPAAPKQYPEYFPADDRHNVEGTFDLRENVGTLQVRYKDRKEVVNYTFSDELLAKQNY